MISRLSVLISLCSSQLFFEISLRRSLIRPMVMQKKLGSYSLLQLSPNYSNQLIRKRVTALRSLSSLQRCWQQICSRFSLASKVKAQYFSAKWAIQAKIYVSYRWISRQVSSAKRSTNFPMSIFSRMTLVAEFLSQQRLETSQQASLLISRLELRKSQKRLGSKLYLCRVSACSLWSATMLPSILIEYFFIYYCFECSASIMHCSVDSSSIIAWMTSSSLLLLNSQKVLNTISWLPGRYFRSGLKEIFLSYMWLTSTQSCFGSVSTILRMSCSLPMTLLPAAMTAISRMSTEAALQKVGRSCSNSFTTVRQFSNSFSSTEASIHSDSQTMCASTCKLQPYLVRYTGWLLRRQKEIVSGAIGGTGVGIGASREWRMASRCCGEQYLRQSSSSTLFRLRWKVSARERRRKCLALALSLFLRGSLIKVYNGCLRAIFYQENSIFHLFFSFPTMSPQLVTDR